MPPMQSMKIFESYRRGATWLTCTQFAMFLGARGRSARRCVATFPTATERSCTRKIYYKEPRGRWKNLHLTINASARGSNEVDARITLHEAGLGNLLGRSRHVQVFSLIQRVAPTEATVMIMGESGSGKELVAECIHVLSHRAQGPLVAINCGSIPASLIEAELFGYEKGSFTGASRSTRACSSAATAARCSSMKSPRCRSTCRRGCRVLETGRFYRVGGTRRSRRTSASSPRPIATSPVAVANGQLREDLMYRLAVFPLHLPPLRERAGDCRRSPSISSACSIAPTARTSGSHRFLPRRCAPIAGRATFAN